jgi:general stress protein CsbA
MLFPVMLLDLFTVVVFGEKYKVTVLSEISCTLE